MKLSRVATLYPWLLIFTLFLEVGSVLAGEEPSIDESGVLEALEAVAAKVSAAPGNCDVVRKEAKLFQEKYGNALKILSSRDAASVDEQVQTRLDSVFEQLSPSLMACGSCSSGPESAEKSQNSKDDPCKDTKKKCERNCPLGGWSCAGHWAGCMSGYRPSCCWAAACGSKKNCMRVCESSCVCSVD